MTLRPYAVVMDGRLEHGLQVTIGAGGVIVHIEPLEGDPEPYVLSSAFVNAHSHLEYRGLLGSFEGLDYMDFIKGISEAKPQQRSDAVREDCLIAALENKRTGVAFIAEHSDRPFAAEAMSAYGLDGRIYQEVITLVQHKDPSEKLASVAESLKRNVEAGGYETVMSPHAPWTVDSSTIAALGAAGDPLSVHVAECVHENDYFHYGKGPIADLCKKFGIEHPVGVSAVKYLESVGVMRPGTQLVHACDVSRDDIALMVQGGVSVAHCPRSNEALDCPRAPVREMLDAGIMVGIGMDSAASGGPIDMFAEMRGALDVATKRDAPLTPEEVWRMATSMGASSVQAGRAWDIIEGGTAPLIKVHIENAHNVLDLIQVGEPRCVRWVTNDVHN